MIEVYIITLAKFIVLGDIIQFFDVLYRGTDFNIAAEFLVGSQHHNVRAMKGCYRPPLNNSTYVLSLPGRYQR